MWWFCDARFNSCLVRPTRVIFFLAAFPTAESAKHTLRGGAVWSARRAHNPKVGGSNPPPATMNYQVIDISRWPFSLSESSASGGGHLETMTPLSFRVNTGYNMLTGIILISILENVANPLLGALEISRRSFFLFTKEPVSESTQEKAKARDDLTLATAGEMFETR